MTITFLDDQFMEVSFEKKFDEQKDQRVVLRRTI